MLWRVGCPHHVRSRGPNIPVCAAARDFEPADGIEWTNAMASANRFVDRGYQPRLRSFHRTRSGDAAATEFGSRGSRSEEPGRNTEELARTAGSQ